MADRELRTFTAEIEARADGDGGARVIEGYGALFDVRTTLYGAGDSALHEVIDKGAFPASALGSVRCLRNHDSESLLGRQPDTLTLRVDDRGLFYRCELPNTTLGREVYESVRRRDLRESSFSFKIAADGASYTRTGDGGVLRRIHRIETVYDCGPVAFAAYEETTVSARSALAARGEADPSGTGDDAETLRAELRAARSDAETLRAILKREREGHRRELARVSELSEIRLARAVRLERRLMALDALAAG